MKTDLIRFIRVIGVIRFYPYSSGFYPCSKAFAENLTIFAGAEPVS